MQPPASHHLWAIYEFADFPVLIRGHIATTRLDTQRSLDTCTIGGLSAIEVATIDDAIVVIIHIVV